MFSCLVCCGEKTPFFLFLLPLSTSSSLLSLGCMGEISRSFSVLQKELQEVSAGSTGLRRMGGGGGGVEKRREKTRDTVTSRSPLNQINCNQLQKTGDGIASLKIQ